MCGVPEKSSRKSSQASLDQSAEEHRGTTNTRAASEAREIELRGTVRADEKAGAGLHRERRQVSGNGGVRVKEEETMKQLTRCNIRYLIRRDMHEVLEIDRRSFEYPWTEDDLIACLRRRNAAAMLAECVNGVTGFMVYELTRETINLLNFAVDPEFRRQGVGHMMVEKLKDKLSQQRRRQIILAVRDSNVPAQLFFKSQNFKATSTMHGYYEGNGEDAIAMRYGLDDEIDWHAVANGEAQLFECADGRILAAHVGE